MHSDLIYYTYYTNMVGGLVAQLVELSFLTQTIRVRGKVPAKWNIFSGLPVQLGPSRPGGKYLAIDQRPIQGVTSNCYLSVSRYRNRDKLRPYEPLWLLKDYFYFFFHGWVAVSTHTPPPPHAGRRTWVRYQAELNSIHMLDITDL